MRLAVALRRPRRSRTPPCQCRLVTGRQLAGDNVAVRCQRRSRRDVRDLRCATGGGRACRRCVGGRLQTIFRFCIETFEPIDATNDAGASSQSSSVRMKSVEERGRTIE